MQISKSYWDIPQLPFVFTPLRQPTNSNGLPDQLPFSLGIDETTGRLLQRADPQVSRALEKAYQQGSMFTGQMDDEGNGRAYADDFLKFLQADDVIPELAGKRVLEIGCGTGYLLYRIKQLGADVTGVEPGSFGEGKYESQGVPIIREFFPTPAIAGQFDAIIIYAVLEHVEDPAQFLRTLAEHLTAEGKIVIAVPNCEPYIATGDISMFIHEHWSYFSRTSLANTIAESGQVKICLTNQTFGGFLYAAVGGNKKGQIPAKKTDVARQKELALQFVKKAQTATTKLVDYVNKIYEQNQSLGIYVPARAINSLASGNAKLKHCRFFDDNSLLRGTYFPGIPISMESKEDLIRTPVDHILVMSFSFGEQIISHLQPLVPANTDFMAVKDLLESSLAQ